jgi:hypothetical protein
MTFSQRAIDLTFQLGTGSFGETGSNTVTVSGLRVSAKITKAGGRSMSSAQLRIYGMTRSVMNSLSTLGMVATLQRRNTVTVQAGDVGPQMATAFIGTIVNGYIDFQSMPEVAFQVEAYSGVIEAVKPIPPSSFPGTADVALIMQGLARQAGLNFENNGVTTKLTNEYFAGSAREQMLACAEHANIEWLIDNGTLAIWPKNGKRRTGTAVVSPQTGLVGYPSYTSKGISLRTLFNSTIRLGDAIEVRSDLKEACGAWNVFNLDHDIEAQVPHGQWFSTMNAARPGQVVIAR